MKSLLFHYPWIEPSLWTPASCFMAMVISCSFVYFNFFFVDFKTKRGQLKRIQRKKNKTMWYSIMTFLMLLSTWKLEVSRKFSTRGTWSQLDARWESHWVTRQRPQTSEMTKRGRISSSTKISPMHKNSFDLFLLPHFIPEEKEIGEIGWPSGFLGCALFSFHTFFCFSCYSA